MELLGQSYTFLLLVAMTALMGGVYFLFMHLGRRLQESGYLGPLASDAIANAEIARREKGLLDDLARGDIEIPAGREPTSDAFKKLYEIPSGALAPELRPGWPWMNITDWRDRIVGTPLPRRVWVRLSRGQRRGVRQKRERNQPALRPRGD